MCQTGFVRCSPSDPALPAHRYGFKSSPTLDLVAKPKLGHREVTLTKVTHWIEKKLHELVNVSGLALHTVTMNI